MSGTGNWSVWCIHDYCNYSRCRRRAGTGLHPERHRSRGLQISSDVELAAQIQPIDVEAFRNLVDPAEDDYLRRRLPASDFRVVRRERLRAMAAYVQLAGRNAAIAGKHWTSGLDAAGDAQTAEAARRLVENALLLRRNCRFRAI